LRKKTKLKELIHKAQSGDKDALNQLIERFKPLINKYANRLGNEDVSSEIIEWLINATMSYKEKESCVKEDFEKFVNNNDDDV